MLIPQFSLRWVLAAMTVLAVLFVFVGQAVRGQPWAVGVTAAAIMLAAVAAVHGLLFFLVWVFSVLFSRRPKQRVPFAQRGAAPFSPGHGPFSPGHGVQSGSLPSQGNE